jgi:hypothetical protein
MSIKKRDNNNNDNNNNINNNNSIKDTSWKVRRTNKTCTKHFPWCFLFITYITRIHT